MLENAAGEELNDLTGDAIDSLELRTEEESDEHSSRSLVDAFLGRRVSDVVLELAAESGGD